ncbi:MAG: DoxX family protein [Candidatus Marinimicrobia bacterium]|jgi:putative oxidoreductase|nr:DoxX family protein [Candidatus Neomarinimicrobiota bacterium]MDP6789706.1 DoxX family protein [Candidatus Neomarinimicrobiota bacterium]
MNNLLAKLKDCCGGKRACMDCGLLVLRILPGYFMIANHGWKKITNPEKWEKLGNAFSKYFLDLLDFANPLFGFIAAFSESVCAVLVLVGLFTRPAAFFTAATMFVDAMYHITGTGSPETALVYFSLFSAVICLGPGKYSLDAVLFKKEK